MTTAAETTQTVEHIDITPTAEGYASMARLFASAVIEDARQERQHDTGIMLGTLVELVAYLARVQSDDEILALVNAIKVDATRPERPTTDDTDDED